MPDSQPVTKFVVLILSLTLSLRATGQKFQTFRSVKPVRQTGESLERKQVASEKASFDVASIRLTKPGEFTPPSFGLSSQDKSGPVGGLFAADFPLIIYIDFAYKLRPSAAEEESMLASLPKWVGIDNYEIQARASGNPSKDQMRVMMQALLADRFKLRVHHELKEMPVLALELVVPGKMGPRLRVHPQNLECSTRDEPFPPVCGVDNLIAKSNRTFSMGSRNVTSSSLATSFGSYRGFDRPVVDRTGLVGTYDYSLEWTEGADTNADLQGTTFLEALHDQLGLKVVRSTAPISVLVIDHVERPSPN